MVDKKKKWNDAGTAGLILGSICIVYTLLGLLLQKIGTESKALALLVSVLNFVLWAAKFTSCLYLLKFFMKKYASGEPEISNKESFGFGVAVSLCSALVFSAFQLADILFISTDTVNDAFNTVISQYSSKFDSNTLNQLDTIKENMPQIAFFSNLLYCFLFGVILSAIYSANIPSKNPFERQNNIDEQ